MATLFLAFCTAWFLILAWVLHRHLPRRPAALALVAFAAWLAYAATLAHRGWLVSERLPPRMLLLAVPLIAFTLWLSLGRAPLALARAAPLRLLIGLQAFRIGVEFFLDALWREGLLPRDMTYHGRNFDIVTGASALLLALLWNRIPRVATVSRIWNIAGLLLLAQVALTGILSAPGPQQILNRETPNLAVVGFPYVFVAALFVVSALALHILALRKLALPRN